MGAGAFALLSCGGAGLTAHSVWTGLTTGAISGKYGLIYRTDRPVTFDITIALNVFACVAWLVFLTIALAILFSRNLDDL